MSRELLAPVPQRDLADWPPERPLVSVVIPCFNYGHLVEEAVDSALGQTLTNLEVIVVEGGSTKVESRRQVANLRRPRTRVLFQEEAARAGANRNLGIENAQGKYIVCLDADDRLRPTFVEKAVFLAETFDVDVVSSAMQIFGDRSDRIDILEQPDLEAMLRGNHVLTCALFRKSFWAAAGGIRDGSGDGHIHEDWAFWIRLAAYGARFLNMPRDPLLLYRSHGPTLSTGENVHPMERQAQLVRSMNEDVVTDEALARSARLAAQERRKIPKPRPADYRLTSDRPGPVLLLAAPWLALGGAERLLSAIVGHLAEAGWRVIIVTSIDMSPDQGDTTDWFERHTAEIYNLPLFLGRQRWDAFLEHLLNSRQVDILWIVGSAYAYSRLVSVRVNHPNLRVVDLLFNTAGHTYNNRLRQNLIDLTLVENREVADWLQQHGESPERVKIIESGVDLEALAPGPRDQGVVRSMKLRPDEILVGFSGRWSEEKYPLAFVEIARRTDHSLPIRFVMTGAGPQRSLVESAVAKAGFPAGRFTLAGIVPDVVPWLRSYDLLVLPSLLDGRPLVVMEALSLGVPVLASRVGALPELIDHGTNGWLCEPGNIDDFVGHIEQFAQRPDRAALRELTRAHAVQHLDQRVMLARYRRALEGSLQGE
jgi:glycosyltransferase involved in cell wall biosynthesis